MVLRGRTRITRKGQITIPAEIRKALGLSEGDQVEFEYQPGARKATLTTESVVERTAGMFKRPGQPQLSDEELKRAIEEAAQQAAIQRDERSKRG